MTDFHLFAALLAVLAPLGAFGLIMLLLRARPRIAAGVSIVAVAISFGAALVLLVSLRHLTVPLVYALRWAAAGSLEIPAGVLLDPLSLLMLAIVSGIALAVQIYSLGYMAGDPGFARYYGFMSLFAWAMISLSISAGMLQLYIFWELVGLSSYLLIGFWHEKFSASQAGKKAFVMTRLGDVAFLIGLLLLLVNVGDLSILRLNQPSLNLQMPPGVLTLALLLIFGGIMGKSAQFPLLTWLPDAMEGPTPVSALLHSATMVAAGVFLFARLFPLFSLSATALGVFMAIGTLSMLSAASMALVSRDIKQVWAYSTISQLGFMIMGLAAGGYVAGVFHLTTHAAFKALLFLCSGVFIHAFHSNDMMEIGRAGGRRLKTPMICMTLAAASLAGLPPLAGFFSKESILAVLSQQANPLWLAAGLLGAFLTAYYAFRLIFIILRPAPHEGNPAEIKPPSQAEASLTIEKTHYRVMAWPLIILTLLTLTLGFAQTAFEHYLSPAGAISHGAGAHGRGLLFTALGCALGGVLLAWLEFGRARAPRIGFVERIPALANFLAERWYLDHLYRWLLEQLVYRGVARFCAKNDQLVIDGLVDGLGKGTVAGGGRLSNLHLSMIQYRLGVLFAVMIALALYFFF